MRRPVIGVMGGGEAAPEHVETAYELGRMIAQNGWVLLNGGRDAGVMEASAKGAHEAGGLTVGILPDDHRGRASAYLDIEIVTGMGSARNNINVLSSDVVIACTGGAGTLSEIALALKAQRPVVTVGLDLGPAFQPYVAQGRLHAVATAHEAILRTTELLARASTDSSPQP